jgi:hypothetical protein
MKRSLHFFTMSLLAATLLASSARAAPGDLVALPNTDFEAPPAANAPLPEGWSAYQWGPTDSKFSSAREAGAGRDGSAAIAARNIDPLARAGIYTHAKLAPGRYEMSVWARAEKGKTARVAMYLASAYSRRFKVSDEWTLLQFQNVISTPLEKAEINIQNSSGMADTVWLDDVSLKQLDDVRYDVSPDTRPTKDRPRTLVFSPINVNYLRETAPLWAERGFGGFLFDQIMNDWTTDVWAVDGDAQTRGADDKLLQETLACNRACRAVGIDANFVKVAFYSEWPDPFDDAAWKQIAENFRQGARFAKMSESKGVAIDTEYIAQQYQPTWEGYAKNPQPLPALKSKVEERWHTILAGMLQEFPDMELLTLPEGVHYYGELYGDLFRGMVGAMAEANAPGGIHVMTEGTYHNTDLGGLDAYAKSVREEIDEVLSPAQRAYWKTHGTIVLGAWPLGYYRDMGIVDGKPTYSGRKETFGDQIVGSYADKSQWYAPEVFAVQMAGLNTFSPKYNWIYAHGAVFWQWSEAEKAKYLAGAHQAASNATLPIISNLDEYFKSIQQPGLAARQ